MYGTVAVALLLAVGTAQGAEPVNAAKVKKCKTECEKKAKACKAKCKGKNKGDCAAGCNLNLGGCRASCEFR